MSASSPTLTSTTVLDPSDQRAVIFVVLDPPRAMLAKLVRSPVTEMTRTEAAPSQLGLVSGNPVSTVDGRRGSRVR